MKIDKIALRRVPALEDCKPGVRPHEYNVLVAMQEAETKTAGGIILTDETKETNAMAAQIGRLVDRSQAAFNYDGEVSDPPKIGDVVTIGRYAGTLFTGQDGREYRILKDRDISGVAVLEGAQ